MLDPQPYAADSRGMEALGVTVSQGLVVAFLFAIVFVPGVVSLLKGQYLLVAAGLLAGGLVWWIVALRLARPDSWWARRNYSTDKINRAAARYGLPS